jgi:hypothetical protein
MSRCTLRYIFTILIYAGVAIFLWPYLTGHISTGLLFLVGGIGLAVISGILRACLMEGDCPDRIPTPPTTHTHTHTHTQH